MAILSMVIFSLWYGCILTMASKQVACTPAAINAAAASPEVVLRLEVLVTDWCGQAEL